MIIVNNCRCGAEPKLKMKSNGFMIECSDDMCVNDNTGVCKLIDVALSRWNRENPMAEKVVEAVQNQKTEVVYQRQSTPQDLAEFLLGAKYQVGTYIPDENESFDAGW